MYSNKFIRINRVRQVNYSSEIQLVTASKYTLANGINFKAIKPRLRTIFNTKTSSEFDAFLFRKGRMVALHTFTKLFLINNFLTQN